jgi:hypothetical protein
MPFFLKNLLNGPEKEAGKQKNSILACCLIIRSRAFPGRPSPGGHPEKNILLEPISKIALSHYRGFFERKI